MGGGVCTEWTGAKEPGNTSAWPRTRLTGMYRSASSCAIRPARSTGSVTPGCLTTSSTGRGSRPFRGSSAALAGSEIPCIGERGGEGWHSCFSHRGESGKSSNTCSERWRKASLDSAAGQKRLGKCAQAYKTEDFERCISDDGASFYYHRY